MALSQRVRTYLGSLAKRGDLFARNVLYKATARDQRLIENFAKRGDLTAQRHIKGAAASPRAKALMSSLSRAGDFIVQGISSIVSDKLAQVITFAQPSGIVLGGSAKTVTLVATSDSGLLVSFAVISGAGATLDGAKLTVATAGSVVIEARQGGGPNHLAAAPVQRTITVTA